MKFYSHYNVPPKVDTSLGDGSMTCQEFKDECDINQIVKKPNFGINPLKPPTRQPQFGDFSDISLNDFYTAQNMLVEAQQMFEALDSNIRKRFDNDPAKLIEFCNDPKNIEEGIKLGIYEKSSANVSEQTISASSEIGPQKDSLDVNVRTDTNQS